VKGRIPRCDQSGSHPSQEPAKDGAPAEIPVNVSGVVTVNVGPLLAIPLTVTTTGPLVAPLGTGAAIELVLQLVGVAELPLNVTLLVLCVGPKLLPLIAILAPTFPLEGCKLVIAGVTVKFTALLGVPLTITTILPVVAAAGTGTTMEPTAQLLGVAPATLNITVLLP
jgi:hypothetical protein